MHLRQRAPPPPPAREYNVWRESVRLSSIIDTFDARVHPARVLGVVEVVEAIEVTEVVRVTGGSGGSFTATVRG